ncbi:IS3 family transposase [bacterium]|nr:IS3 family transposase [bacterium]
MSERKSARLVRISRSSLKYQPRPSRDPELVERIKKIACREKRYGYRRVWAELRREGEVLNSNGFIGCGAERVLRCDGENAVGKS